MSKAETLVERSNIAEAVSHLLERAGQGRGWALFVIGEAGMGKTAVLDDACGQAVDRGFAVGLGRGEAMETSLPFGLLGQVFAALGGRQVLEGSEEGLSPDARAAQFYSAFRWLQRRRRAPLLLALDDLQWADADSLALVSFLCRRIDSLPVAVLATLRPWPRPTSEVASAMVQQGHAVIEQLSPLTEAGAALLLAARIGQVPPDSDVRRAQELCAGNPLLLEQVALALGRGEVVPSPRQADSRQASEELLLSRFAGLTPAGMRWAQAAGVFGTRFRPELAQQLAQVDGAEADDALEALGRSGLVRVAREGGTEFVHPLFRQALYDDLAEPSRARLHARAFALLARRGLDSEASEHVLRADMAGDVEAIALLERVGRAALRAGALETASTILRGAAELAGEQASPELLLDLTDVLGSGGRPGDAIGVGERLLAREGLDMRIRAQALMVLARALSYSGAYGAAARRFEESAELAKGLDPAFAVRTLVTYAFASWFFVGPPKALAVSRLAKEVAQSCGDAEVWRANAAWGLSALETGDAQGLELCAKAARSVEADPLLASGDVSSPWGALTSYASAAMYTERLADSERFFGVALRAAERIGNPEQEAAAAIACVDTLTRCLRFNDGLALVERCAQLTDLVLLAEPFAAVRRSTILLLMGELEDAEAWARRAEPIVTAIGAWSPKLWLSWCRGWRLLSEGRLVEACRLYADVEETVAQLGIGEPCEVPWASHAIAAYVGCGRENDARRLISWLEDCGGRLPCRWPRIAAAIGRARLAESSRDQKAADELYSEALRLQDEVDLPLERFQTLLEYGRFLRRSGQLARARPFLAEALELAEVGGARWLAAQAREELRVAGGRRRRRHEEPGRLTAQEQRVAELAASGATNPEIARQLYLSVSTVETHLERVYTKLGIHSRREIAAAIDAPRPVR